MVAKRKRDSSVTSTPASANAGIDKNVAGPSSDAPKSDRKGKAKEVEGDEGHKGPKVHYTYADGSQSWEKSLDLDRDYAKSLKHIAKKLGLPKRESDQLRLAHVRDGGREVEIWDDFDYQAFKARAVAGQGALSLKVYGMPKSGESATPLGSEHKGDRSKATDSSVKKSKQAASPGLPSPSPAPSQTSKQKQKQPKESRSSTSFSLPTVGAASPSDTPSSEPALTSSPAHSESSKKNKKDTKRKSTSASEVSSAPTPASPAPSAPSTPSPFNFGRPIAALKFTDRYKPARPSPLNPNRATVPEPLPAPTPPTSKEVDAEKEAKLRKRQRRKSRREAREDGNSDISRSSTPQATPQRQEPVAQASVPEKEVSAEVRHEGTDTSPPRKRSRKSISKQRQPTSASSSPRPSTASSTPEPAGTADANQPEIAVKPSPGPKKVVRISTEEYDLLKKPKESKLESSSVNGEKKRQRRKSQATDGHSEVSAAEGTSTRDASVALKESIETESASSPATVQKPKAKIGKSKSQTPAGEKVKSATPTQTANVPTDPALVASSSTPTAIKKGKSKASANPQPPAPTSDDSVFGNGSIPVSERSSSPVPSSDPPSTPDSTPSKKGRTPRTKKKAEPAKPSLIAEILQRQKERLAAEAAAKTAGTGETILQADQSQTPATEQNTTSSATSEEPASLATIAQGEQDATSTSAVEPAVEDQASIETPVVHESVTTGGPSITSDGSQSPSLESNAMNDAPDVVSASIIDDAGDLEMRERTPEVEPIAEAAAPVFMPEETSSVAEDAAPIPEATVEPEVADTTAQPAVHDEVLVTETVLPQQSEKAMPSSSKKSAKDKSRKSEVPCIICLQTPWHIQKNCPEVKAGSENLRYLLQARQDQHNSIANGDDDSHFTQSVEAIQEWVERLEMISGKVTGQGQGVGKKSAFKPRSPLQVMGSKDGQTLDLNAASPLRLGKHVVGPPVDLTTDTSPSPSPIAEALTQDLKEKESADSIGSEQAPGPSQTIRTPPETPIDSPTTVPDTYNFPPIHLRAMQKSRRPGSLSGLSVSDAIIETEPSDESDSDDDDESDDDGAASGSESESSVVSSTSASISSETDSDNSDGSATSRVVMPSDPSSAMKFSLTRDLSEREKKKARLSAAKMHPVTFDQESVIGDEEMDSDNEDVTPTAPMPIRLPRARSGSDSSIGDFGDDVSRRSSIDSTTTAPYRSQAPPVIASSNLPARSPSPAPSAASEAESIEHAQDPTPRDRTVTPEAEIIDSIEDTPSTAAPTSETVIDIDNDSEAGDGEGRIIDGPSSGQMSRSFRDIEMTAASSPDLDIGRIAVQQGIDDEEDEPSSTNADDDAAAETDSLAPLPVATQSLSQARRTRGQSRAASESEDVIVPPSQPLRRSSRSRTASVPPQETVPRRLRSVSREVQEETPPPPSRSTRSTSRSLAPMSPSTPKVQTRRSSRTMPLEAEGADEETPKQAPTRRTRVTRSTQPETLPPIEESSQSQSQSQPEVTPAIDRQTQPTPVPRRSTRASPSPLFMTQGSQIPATQFYDAQPETLATEPSSSLPARANGRATSPIFERDEEDYEMSESTPPATQLSLQMPSSAQKPPPSTQDSQVSNKADDDDDDEAGDGDIEMDAQSQATQSSDEGDDESNDIPDIQPPKPRVLPSSQSSTTAPIYPSLSQLPKDFLRQGIRSTLSFFGGNGAPATPVVTKNGNANGNSNAQKRATEEESDDDSGSSSDSSVERAQAPPSILKGRFASGGMGKKKPVKAAPAGW